MGLFDDWCDCVKETERRKTYLGLGEKAGGRDGVKCHLARTVRSHYDALERIADDIERLGYASASNILRERLPRSARARSGELGEILATELAEEMLGFNVPVRRLRYKDGREMAMRGDDFIGVGYDSEGNLWLLKGESKSRASLTKAVIAEARGALDRDHGRCTPSSLLFVADRLLDGDEDDIELGRTIRKEIGQKAPRPNRIDHAIFTFSGNAAHAALKEDLDGADGRRRQTVANLRIRDHQDFIAEIYEEAGTLGND
ncbi:MAG: Hachiman antiphage defense system protein HamA [Hyphomicrobiaceae bacterium]